MWSFNLTKDERKIIVFLILTALIGSAINYYKKTQNRFELRITPSNLNKPAQDIEATLKQAKIVNINLANLEQLTKLPGIGPALAERIIKYRDKNGPFKDIEDLKSVTGIGNRKFEEIREFLTLD